MSQSHSRRDKLIEARNALRQQIAVLDGGPADACNAPGINRQFIDQADGLRSMLANIDEQLTQMGVSE